MSRKEWQLQLGFSDRLSATMKLTSACKVAYPNLETAKIQDTARSLETSAFNEASSKEDYIERWENALSELQVSSQPSGESQQSEQPVTILFQPKQYTIGPYHTSATYHRSGLFSTIYKSYDSNISSVVALKLTYPSQMSPPHDSKQEARILAKGKHSNVIPLLSTFTQPGGRFILVFPFMPHTLEEVIHEGNVQFRTLRSHLRDLFSALAHLHSLSIIHRDVKPSNILLASPSGPAYLADFGIAWMDGDAASELREKKITDVGTTAYRPPELLFGHTAYGNSLDLWAVGCVVAECFLGGKRTLFDAGPLGSELALIHSIFKTLGTPANETWPEANEFSDWGKMAFYKYPARLWTDILPDAPAAVRDLIGKLVRYQSTERLGAAQALSHDLFQEI